MGADCLFFWYCFFPLIVIMCLFPKQNLNYTGTAYLRGLREFECGHCPECLSKRANVWALRAVYESRDHADNCMVTLTYDNYLRDKSGRIIGELPPDRSLVVNKRDIQLFIKRLRKHFSDTSIKYLAAAEYGSHTHRAHYHLILFGVKFPDLIYYKKSSRGNRIYKSPLLEELWGHGICTVDSINITSAVASYCTKYTAKSRSKDTFMLFSHQIGLKGLLADFNGKNYIVDGREHPIPRIIWQHYISAKYDWIPDLDYHYVNLTDTTFLDGSFALSKLRRSVYYAVRNSDPIYTSYINYWSFRSSEFENLRPSVFQRILLLPPKFADYRSRALFVYNYRRSTGIPITAPDCSFSREYGRWLFKMHTLPSDRPTICRISPCHNTANDTNSLKKVKSYYCSASELLENCKIFPSSYNFIQNSIDILV